MLNIDEITGYVNDNKTQLITKAVLLGDTISKMNLVEGVKKSANLHTVINDVNLQDGNTCGFNPANSQNFTNRVLEVGSYAVQDEICPKDFQNTWQSYELKIAATANEKNVPNFVEYWTNNTVEQIQAENERLVWLGGLDEDATIEADGLVKILNAEADTIKPTIASGATMFDKVMAAYLAMPVEISKRDDAFIAVNWADFKALTYELIQKNLYNYATALNADNGVLVLPGTNCKIYAVSGLGTESYVIAGAWGECYVGTDILGDSSDYYVWMTDKRTIALDIQFNLGVQVAFPSNFVLIAE